MATRAGVFERSERPLRRFLQRRIGVHADDAYQETVKRGLEAVERFDGRSSFSTFLTAIARNVAREQYRARTRREWVVGLGDADVYAAEVEDIDLVLDRHRATVQLAAAIAMLEPHHRDLLCWYYWHEISAAEIGRTIGVSENTVRSRLRRAKALLRQQFDATGHDSISRQSPT